MKPVTVIVPLTISNVSSLHSKLDNIIKVQGLELSWWSYNEVMELLSVTDEFR